MDTTQKFQEPKANSVAEEQRNCIVEEPNHNGNWVDLVVEESETESAQIDIISMSTVDPNYVKEFREKLILVWDKLPPRPKQTLIMAQMKIREYFLAENLPEPTLESFFDPVGNALMRIRSKIPIHRKTFRSGLLFEWLARERVGTYTVLDYKSNKGFMKAKIC